MRVLGFFLGPPNNHTGNDGYDKGQRNFHGRNNRFSFRRLISHRDQINCDPDERSGNNGFEKDFHPFVAIGQNALGRADS